MLGERTDPVPIGDVLVELSCDSAVALHLADRDVDPATASAAGGRLPRGTPLPATRRLGSEPGVSRGVVIEAYQQLVAEGHLTSRAGGYTRVAGDGDGAQSRVRRARAAAARPPAAEIDFCPCRADGSMFPRAEWLRSMRRVVMAADFGYVDGRGAPPLHDALAACSTGCAASRSASGASRWSPGRWRTSARRRAADAP